MPEQPRQAWEIKMDQEKAEKERIWFEDEYIKKATDQMTSNGITAENIKAYTDRYLKPIYSAYRETISYLESDDGIDEFGKKIILTALNCCLEITYGIGSTSRDNIIASLSSNLEQARKSSIRDQKTYDGRIFAIESLKSVVESF